MAAPSSVSKIKCPRAPLRAPLRAAASTDLAGEGLPAGVDADGQDPDYAALAEHHLRIIAELHERARHPQILHLHVGREKGMGERGDGVCDVCVASGPRAQRACRSN